MRSIMWVVYMVFISHSSMMVERFFCRRIAPIGKCDLSISRYRLVITEPNVPVKEEEVGYALLSCSYHRRISRCSPRTMPIPLFSCSITGWSESWDRSWIEKTTEFSSDASGYFWWWWYDFGSRNDFNKTRLPIRTEPHIAVDRTSTEKNKYASRR